MIRWQLSDPFEPDFEVTASLPVTTQNQRASLTLEGNPEEVKALTLRFQLESGAYGHKLDIKSITAIDADYILRQDRVVEIIEGAEIMKGGYNPEVGDGLI